MPLEGTGEAFVRGNLWKEQVRLQLGETHTTGATVFVLEKYEQLKIKLTAEAPAWEWTFLTVCLSVCMSSFLPSPNGEGGI